MPKFSPRSEKNLSTCHPKIQETLRDAIKEIDFSVTCGFRGKEEQDKIFLDGTSKVNWPNSYHNRYPSHAVDIQPYPHNPNDIDAFLALSDVVERIAGEKGYDIKCMGKLWGWDYYHYQLRGE